MGLPSTVRSGSSTAAGAACAMSAERSLRYPLSSANIGIRFFVRASSCTARGDDRLPAPRFSEDQGAEVFQHVGKLRFPVWWHPAKLELHVNRNLGGFFECGESSLHVTIEGSARSNWARYCCSSSAVIVYFQHYARKEICKARDVLDL